VDAPGSESLNVTELVEVWIGTDDPIAPSLDRMSCVTSISSAKMLCLHQMASSIYNELVGSFHLEIQGIDRLP